MSGFPCGLGTGRSPEPRRRRGVGAVVRNESSAIPTIEHGRDRGGIRKREAPGRRAGHVPLPTVDRVVSGPRERFDEAAVAQLEADGPPVAEDVMIVRQQPRPQTRSRPAAEGIGGKAMREVGAALGQQVERWRLRRAVTGVTERIPALLIGHQDQDVVALVRHISRPSHQSVGRNDGGLVELRAMECVGSIACLDSGTNRFAGSIDSARRAIACSPASRSGLATLASCEQCGAGSGPAGPTRRYVRPETSASSALGPDVVPGQHAAVASPGVVDSGQVLDDRRLLISEVVHLRAVARHIVKFPVPRELAD